jgi:hypothetical protein
MPAARPRPQTRVFLLSLGLSLPGGCGLDLSAQVIGLERLGAKLREAIRITF